ncbi:hypothetical protein TNCV_4001731 [Trichonephila clavipes]|uniref:Uncharacterized protein n=1 Tax=Trichonephila clavipes TaxID=2585209 RepID=A0A8X6RTB2_TRICX|nr:hypothetical protein TNCV_4001731 [Trichonephila clavipes]
MVEETSQQEATYRDSPLALLETFRTMAFFTRHPRARGGNRNFPAPLKFNDQSSHGLVIDVVKLWARIIVQTHVGISRLKSIQVRSSRCPDVEFWRIGYSPRYYPGHLTKAQS